MAYHCEHVSRAPKADLVLACQLCMQPHHLSLKYPDLLCLMQATNPELDPEQLRGLVAMGTDGAAQTQAVQRLLELPLATASSGAPRTLSLVPPQPHAAQAGADDGAQGRARSSSTGRRRRASSEPQAEVAADGSEIVSGAAWAGFSCPEEIFGWHAG